MTDRDDLASVTAEGLIDSSVVNANEETLGTVDDALLSSDGKIESSTDRDVNVDRREQVRRDVDRP